MFWFHIIHSHAWLIHNKLGWFSSKTVMHQGIFTSEIRNIHRQCMNDNSTLQLILGFRFLLVFFFDIRRIPLGI